MGSFWSEKRAKKLRGTVTADLASPKTLRALSYLQPISCRHQKTTVPYGKALERKNYRSKKKLLLLHYLRATVRLCPCHLTTPPATYRVGGGGVGLGGGDWSALRPSPSVERKCCHFMRSTFHIHTTSKTSRSRKFERAPNYKSYELSFDMSDKEQLTIYFILFQAPDYLSIILFL